MDLARIAQLLEPFLQPAPSVQADSKAPDICHSEPAKPEACPERLGSESGVLSSAQLQSISTYIDLLLRWNARINLTAIRDPEEIVTRHFGESLFAARHLFPCDPGGRVALQGHVRGHEEIGASAPEEMTAADLGSGAGFPGIPIKLWAPQITTTLIESNHKKATFLREVARALTLTNINIQTARAESLPPHSYDVITIRAVERLEAVLPTASQLLKPSGRLAVLIGASQLEPTRAALPLRWSAPLPIPTSHSRILLIGQQSDSLARPEQWYQDIH